MKNLIFRQLFEKESSTYSYVLADKNSMDGIIIDPVIETLERDSKLIKELGINLKYIIDTHIHADHVTASSHLKDIFTKSQIVGSNHYDIDCPDIKLGEGDKLDFGEFEINVIETPGHTIGCRSYIIGNMIFSGDSMLIRSCGRCDFQGGSPDNMYKSLNKILSFPDKYLIFPAHDYNGVEVTSVREEKQYNEMIGNNENLEGFTQKINNLKLDLPKKMHYAVPSNQVCGKEIIGK